MWTHQDSMQHEIKTLKMRLMWLNWINLIRSARLDVAIKNKEKRYAKLMDSAIEERETESKLRDLLGALSDID